MIEEVTATRLEIYCLCHKVVSSLTGYIVTSAIRRGLCFVCYALLKYNFRAQDLSPFSGKKLRERLSEMAQNFGISACLSSVTKLFLALFP
jgi:hypothetical protein